MAALDGPVRARRGAAARAAATRASGLAGARPAIGRRRQSTRAPANAAVFEVGVRVLVQGAVRQPRFGWGQVTHGSVGTIASLDADGRRCLIEFPEHSRWIADLGELELAEPRVEHPFPGGWPGCGGNPRGTARCRGNGSCSSECRGCGASTHWRCCGSTDPHSRYCRPGITAAQARANHERAYARYEPSNPPPEYPPEQPDRERRAQGGGGGRALVPPRAHPSERRARREEEAAAALPLASHEARLVEMGFEAASAHRAVGEAARAMPSAARSSPMRLFDAALQRLLDASVAPTAATRAADPPTPDGADSPIQRADDSVQLADLLAACAAADRTLAPLDPPMPPRYR